MTKETLFEQIDEIFGDWHGGICYIGKERENQVKEILEKAINYNRCSTQLKDKEAPTFKEWRKKLGYKKVKNTCNYSNGFAVINKWNLKNTYEKTYII